MTNNRGAKPMISGTLAGAMRRTVIATSVVLASSFAALAADDVPEIPRQKWTFSGMFGHYDQGQLQRGLQVYREVCASCHAMRLLKFRNLNEPGGPALPEAAVKELAKQAKYPEINDNGKTIEREGKPSDPLPSPFKNNQEARSANNGALPPDFSVIAKARSAAVHIAWYAEPVQWAKDIVTGYQEGGADYIYSLLTGYKDQPPAGMKNADGTAFKLADGMYYNAMYAGHQIGMPAPLSEGVVKYTDGTKASVENYARDVSAFLMWGAEPKLDQRKRTGFQVLIYLGVTALLLWLAKRRLWARLEH